METIIARISRKKGERHTNHCSSEYLQTSPMSSPEAFVAPSQVGGKGSRSRMCVGLFDKYLTSRIQVRSSSCTSEERGNRLPRAYHRACFRRVNIPLDPATHGGMLLRIPNICLHLCRETWRDALGMAAKAVRTVSSIFGVILKWFCFVSRYHPRTILLVDQAASPWRGFFVDSASF